MKITGVRTFVVGNPWKNWLFVKVDTDEGVSGLGEATGGLATKPHLGDVEELARFVVGEDPRHPEALWHRMLKGRFLRPSLGMSGIEIACWDILGKSLGAPLYRLLGGARHPLRVYANGWYRCPRKPDAFVECALTVAKMGYTAMKFDPFGAAYLDMGPAEERLSLDIVRAVREAVGDEVDLMVEGHDRFTSATAVRIGRALEEFAPAWFETPVNSQDVRATAEVARRIPVPVASGERLRYLSEFVDLLEPRTVSILQPEPLHCGGVGGAMKAAALAEAHGAAVACHQAQSPLGTALNAHLHAAMPSFMIQECFDDFLEPWAREVFTGVPRVVESRIEPSDAPGIGVELNEEEAARHPYGEDAFIRLFESGWEGRGR
jgi:galactonate dehydratase